MKLTRHIRNFFRPKRDLVPIFTQQAAFLCQSAEALGGMLDAGGPSEWHRYEKEIKACEVQGDALLTEFQEQITGRLMGSINRLDLQTIAMSVDDCLDVLKDASKAVTIYHPKKIDPQLRELVQLMIDETRAIRELLPMLWDIRHKSSSIILQCERVTELEHAADEVYEEYVGYIFESEPDLREMTKYKSLAEIFEKATDSGKRVADNVRKLLLQFHLE